MKVTWDSFSDKKNGSNGTRLYYLYRYNGHLPLRKGNCICSFMDPREAYYTLHLMELYLPQARWSVKRQIAR